MLTQAQIIVPQLFSDQMSPLEEDSPRLSKAATENELLKGKHEGVPIWEPADMPRGPLERYHHPNGKKRTEEKTAFYMEARTYCYNPEDAVGLKKGGAGGPTYQRLSDSSFGEASKYAVEMRIISKFLHNSQNARNLSGNRRHRGMDNLYTDSGQPRSKGSGAGLILTGPSGVEYAYALRLTFASTNNEAEYEALLAGLPSNGSMIKYLAKARKYISEFKTFSIENIPRGSNQKADVLSKLATVPFHHLTKEILVEVLNERSTEILEVQTIVEEEGDNWMTPIIKYLEEGVVPSDNNEARALRAKIGQYTMESGVLFKKGYLIPMLRCVGPLLGKLCHSGKYHMGVLAECMLVLER
ncbi:reverse transcriptase domain-containing protein [Tanacetum coccineum]